MSVVLVCFPGAPKISEEAVKKEEELDKYLETRVEGQHIKGLISPCLNMSPRFPVTTFDRISILRSV